MNVLKSGFEVYSKDVGRGIESTSENARRNKVVDIFFFAFS